MCFKTLQKNYHVSIFLLRVAIACIFLAHGYMKFSNFDSLPTLMKILAIAEPLGGIAMLIGLLTRWAALGLSIIMLGAIYMKITAMGIGYTGGPGAGWEFDLLILASCIMMMTMGAGKWSMDAKTGWDRA